MSAYSEVYVVTLKVAPCAGSEGLSVTTRSKRTPCEMCVSSPTWGLGAQVSKLERLSVECLS